MRSDWSLQIADSAALQAACCTLSYPLPHGPHAVPSPMSSPFTKRTFAFLSNSPPTTSGTGSMPTRIGTRRTCDSLRSTSSMSSPSAWSRSRRTLWRIPANSADRSFVSQRDTRFAEDKTPYKTHTGMQFRHVATTDDVHAPALHARRARCLLRRCRAVAPRHARRSADPHQDHRRTGGVEEKAAYGKRFYRRVHARWRLVGAAPQRRRPPIPPYAEDIKRKDFIGGSTLTDKQVSSDSFLTDYTDMCKRAAPFMEFLCEAVGVEF